MNKYLKFILIILTISLCILITNFINNKKQSNNSNQLNNLKTKEITKYEIINQDTNPYTIYYYGINSATINLNDKKHEINKAIKENKITLDEILNEMEIYGEINDGGTKIYRNNNNLKLFNDNYTIIKCNRINGSKDIYIGDNEMKYVKTFCTFNPTESGIKLQTEILKILNTTKIKVISENNGVTKKIITNKNKIDEIINIISNLEEDTSDITTSEKNNYTLLMYDSNNNLLSRISIWKNGPIGFDENKGYFLNKKYDNNIIKDLIEQ